MEEEILLVVPGSGILVNETVISPFVEPDAEPPDDQLYGKKNLAELVAEICERASKEKWGRICRIDLRLSEDEINYVKQRYISQDEMYENIKEFSSKDDHNFRFIRDLLGQYGIEVLDEARKKSGFGFEAEDIYNLVDCVPLKDRYNFVCHTLGNENIHATQLHDGLFPREVMEAMLEYWCEKENATVDSLQNVLNVGEKKGYLEPKKNATQKQMANAEGKKQSEGEVFLKPKERIEEVFQKEIIKALPGITEFKKFARVSSGLDLDELVIQDITENYKGDVEKQKLKFLDKWKKKNGKQATIFNIRKLLASYQDGDEGGEEFKKKWHKLAQSQPGILEEWGSVGYNSKLQMLRYWRQTRENKESASVTAIKLMEDFLQKKAKKGIFRNLDFDFVCDVIANAIKDEDWMEFAGAKLELRDEDIK